MNMTGMKRGKSSASQLGADGNVWDNTASQSEVLLEANLRVQKDVSNGIKQSKLSTVFKGKLFHFSSSFPEEQRPEIVQWVNEGGGEVAPDQNGKHVDFIVECHGVVPCMNDIVRSTYVSSHWIYSCIEDGCLLDVGSHMLYSPLPCQIPLPGFEGHRLCVSRYDMKERQLLRNLCYVLGVKFIDKLTKKTTHLLCKFADGDKYEAACRWGIQIVTAEWIYQCVIQNKVVDGKSFYPKELTSLDREAGISIASQYPLESVRIISRDNGSQPISQSQDLRNMQTIDAECVVRDEAKCLKSHSKRARISGNDIVKLPLSCVSTDDSSIHVKNIAENNSTKNDRGVSLVVPDVAAAIEDLLEQTSKIQDQKSQETRGCDQNLLSSNSPILGQRSAHPHSDLIPSRQWINRSDKSEDNPSGDAAGKGGHDGFSETQTDSQVVGYEEDLSGRQMIIERVRTRSSLT